ncbi:hypothetical protein OIU78_005709 [Salix suchowensis]|nr:hypothetical protein OIU78_005709 [Salix suchowensis]
MLLSPLRKLAREELVSCFHINSRLSYYDSKFNCDIGPFKVDISNRRNYSSQVLFGSIRRVQLWLEKLGAKEPFSGNMATCWSNAKEEEALERYKLITGNTILFPRFQVYGKNNLKDDWLAASPDGIVDNLFRLFRDEAYWDALKIALSDFWFNHVLPAKELCGKNVITDPLKELGSLKPAPRHELLTSELVYCIFSTMASSSPFSFFPY